MKKTAALAAVAVMLGVGGCAAAEPVSAEAAAIAHVQENWIGEDVPDAENVSEMFVWACLLYMEHGEMWGGETLTPTDYANTTMTAEAAKGFC